ncbi:hypothetical protein J7E83_01980 [Arthrobacter sp. ISL-48]|uniref:hypothetical protein n=1 Tax=Arthrobacter sp. ISL-48 TaxID=2819110 RepID=UPI001BECC1FF|nr:hypothetical protein [Arthrobacter sp. ISL-48]MBT2530911.1 hypothetical protein [Arthrobacter sp. ISL-48]
MNTVLLAPGLELPVTGMPYGETPVLDVDHRRRRLIRRVFVRTGMLITMFVAAASLFWHLGQPLWGNWPQMDATVTSQDEYVSRGTHCSLGLSYTVDDQYSTPITPSSTRAASHWPSVPWSKSASTPATTGR